MNVSILKALDKVALRLGHKGLLDSEDRSSHKGEAGRPIREQEELRLGRRSLCLTRRLGSSCKVALKAA